MSTTYQTRHGLPETHEEPSLIARLPEIAGRAAWKHRFRLAPLYLALSATFGVLAGIGLGMSGALGLTAVGAEVAARTEWKVRGRMLLSARERHLAALGLAATAMWCVVASTLTFLHPLITASLLPAALVGPSIGWVRGRKPTPPPVPVYSALAQHVLDGWAGDISVGDGPRAMRGSVPLLDTLEEPTDGALAINFQLARNVHADDAVGAATRKSIEALLGMPKDTVRLETIRDHSTQVRAVFTPARHLEVEGGLEWPGPVLYEDGLMPLAETADGGTVAIPLFTKSGIRHGAITGTSDAGKSVSSVSVLLPGVKAGVEIVLLVDGKRGTSTPYLRPVCGKYARLPQQWGILIDIAHKIMIDREERRGALGLHEWRTLEEADPIITLFIDEATTVNRQISGKQVRHVSEMLEHGRAVGVRVIQASQSPAAEDLIGGVQARGLMGGAGFMICHRAGGSGASRLTLDSTNVDVSLKGLPNGQAAVTVTGQLVGYPAQVRHATKERVLEEIESIEVRRLEGADLASVATAWNAPHWDDCWTPGYVFGETAAPSLGKEPRPSLTSVAPLDDLPESRLWVLDQLVATPAGMTLALLGEAAEADPQDGPSRSTISRALSDLMGSKKVSKNGAIWTAVPAEDTDALIEETA